MWVRIWSQVSKFKRPRSEIKSQGNPRNSQIWSFRGTLISNIEIRRVWAIHWEYPLLTMEKKREVSKCCTKIWNRQRHPHHLLCLLISLLRLRARLGCWTHPLRGRLKWQELYFQFYLSSELCLTPLIHEHCQFLKTSIISTYLWKKERQGLSQSLDSLLL